MDVYALGVSGAADDADPVAAFDPIPFFDRDRFEVSEARNIAVEVVDLDGVAELRVRGNRGDDPRGRGRNDAPLRCGDIDPRMGLEVSPVHFSETRRYGTLDRQSPRHEIATTTRFGGGGFQLREEGCFEGIIEDGRQPCAAGRCECRRAALFRLAADRLRHPFAQRGRARKLLFELYYLDPLLTKHPIFGVQRAVFSDEFRRAAAEHDADHEEDYPKKQHHRHHDDLPSLETDAHRPLAVVRNQKDCQSVFDRQVISPR